MPTPFLTQRESREKVSADAASILSETTTHYITPNRFPLGYIFSQSSFPCLLPFPPRVHRPSGPPPVVTGIGLSRVIGAILVVGMEGKKRVKKRQKIEEDEEEEENQGGKEGNCNNKRQYNIKTGG